MTCQHDKFERGRNIPLRYGSHQSHVCKACGAYRHASHSDGSAIGEWKPADQYEWATREDDDE